jgi:hypothetical protein
MTTEERTKRGKKIKKEEEEGNIAFLYIKAVDNKVVR